MFSTSSMSCQRRGSRIHTASLENAESVHQLHPLPRCPGAISWSMGQTMIQRHHCSLKEEPEPGLLSCSDFCLFNPHVYAFLESHSTNERTKLIKKMITNWLASELVAPKSSWISAFWEGSPYSLIRDWQNPVCFSGCWMAALNFQVSIFCPSCSLQLLDSF